MSKHPNSSKTPKRLRFSPQRDCIKQIVTGQSGHLAVDKIFEQARQIHPKVSLATVYRNLQELEAQKLISVVQGLDNRVYYERFSAPHHHFICRGCGEIQNIQTPNVQICTGCISSRLPIQIETMVTTLFGQCAQCRTQTILTPNL